jgi:hypothetical protein
MVSVETIWQRPGLDLIEVKDPAARSHDGAENVNGSTRAQKASAQKKPAQGRCAGTRLAPVRARWQSDS